MRHSNSNYSQWVSIVLALLFMCPALSAQTPQETLDISGLIENVEIVKDIWGISHIYAKNQKDLFFAQGFNVARDRLFQLEIWRRMATGTMSGILGERAVQNDTGARLFKFRGDMIQEMNHYHPDGEEIITSFVSGINAYVDLTLENPDLLPVEFRLLGIKPGHWTPEVVVSRHNGLYRNVRSEISLAQRVQELGGNLVKQLSNFQPDNLELNLDDAIDASIIPDNVLSLYRSRSSRTRFIPEDIVDPAYKGENDSGGLFDSFMLDPVNYPDQGSNNWVVSGDKTYSRYPIMANDPHRSQQIPSLRYFVHLNAPGWNVIGGGEPVLPGLSIGHNEHGAWGLTIFSVDQEDLYIYDLKPDNPHQYMYRGNWENMTIIHESIPVKGQSSVQVELKYTRHGPVVYIDNENNKAYAVRAAWLEVGSAPYLASLRMDQASTWEEFRDACSYSRTPSENMVWADKYGNIGWQAVGITPIRNNWYGVMPVPGDGRYEWDGYLPVLELPNTFNPPEGYLVTANEYNVPHGYPYRLGYSWSNPNRVNRIKEVLESGRKFTITDMMRLQHDELSVPARTLVPFLSGILPDNPITQTAHQMLVSWDYVLDKNSVSAAIYTYWESRLRSNVNELTRRAFGPNTPRSDLIQLIAAPDGRFGSNPAERRDELLIRSLDEAVDNMIEELGSGMENWQYGQEKIHYIKMSHMLSGAVSQDLRERLDLGPLPRGGGSTVNSTGRGNQRSGASFRIIADTGNWDNSVGTNNPGQSGDPDNPHYSDLFKMWAEGDYFPLLFTRAKIEMSGESITILRSKK